MGSLYYDIARSFMRRQGQTNWKDTNSTDGGAWYPARLEQINGQKISFSLGSGTHAVNVTPEDQVLFTKHKYLRGNTSKWTAGGWTQGFATMFASRVVCGVSKTGFQGFGVRDFDVEIKEDDGVYVFTPFTIMTPTAIKNLAWAPNNARWIGSQELYREVQAQMKKLLTVFRLTADSGEYNALGNDINWEDLANWDGEEHAANMVHSMMSNVSVERWCRRTRSWKEPHEMAPDRMRRFRVVYSSEFTAAFMHKMRGDFPLYTAEYPYPYAPMPYNFKLQ
jgi:hypothetical protein